MGFLAAGWNFAHGWLGLLTQDFRKDTQMALTLTGVQIASSCFLSFVRCLVLYLTYYIYAREGCDDLIKSHVCHLFHSLLTLDFNL